MSSTSIELEILPPISSTLSSLHSTPSRTEGGMANRSESDPLLLRSRVMHDEGLEALRKRKTAGGGGFFKRDSKKKEVVGFYETQNEVSGTERERGRVEAT